MLELNTTSPLHLILGFMQLFQTANVLLNVNAQITTNINQVWQGHPFLLIAAATLLLLPVIWNLQSGQLVTKLSSHEQLCR